MGVCTLQTGGGDEKTRETLNNVYLRPSCLYFRLAWFEVFFLQNILFIKNSMYINL